MLSPAIMWIIAVAFILLPFVLSYTMNGSHQADARGRRMRTTWTTKPPRRR